MPRLSNVTNAEVEAAFGRYSIPVNDAHEKVSDRFKTLARFILLSIPPGKERQYALYELQKSSLWAHKALSQNNLVNDDISESENDNG